MSQKTAAHEQEGILAEHGVTSELAHFELYNFSCLYNQNQNTNAIFIFKSNNIENTFNFKGYYLKKK